MSEPREHECIQCGAMFIVQCPVTTPEGWRWECPSCDGPVTAMGMCETCGVFGVMRIGLSEAVARLAAPKELDQG